MSCMIIDLANANQESIILRGIAEAILSQKLTSMDGVKPLFEEFGIVLKTVQEVEQEQADLDQLYTLTSERDDSFLQVQDSFKQGVVTQEGVKTIGGGM